MAVRSRSATPGRLDPNLASAPFLNARPVERLALFLWVLALVVGGAAYWSTASSRQEAGARRAELERLSAETGALRERARQLHAELEASDLAARNERTLFLNQRIAERAFSWNDLIDAMGEVLPRGVRLRDLTPEGFQVQSGTRRASEESKATSRVNLRISGEAEEGEALLEFVDRLYRHPAFDKPNLARESAKKDQQLEFSLGVAYIPGWRIAASAATAGTVATAAAVTAGSVPARGEEAVEPIARPVTAVGDPVSPAVGTVPAPNPQSGSAAAPLGSGVAASRRYAPPAAGGETRGTVSAWGDGATSDEAEGRQPAGRSSAGQRPISGSTGGGSSVPVLPAPLKPFASAPPELR